MMTLDIVTEETSLTTYFEEAERIAFEHKTRLTPIRRHIYKCLLKTQTPLGAYEIMDMLDGVGSQKPPTVYRALDWLIGVGLVKKIASISKYMVTHSSYQTALLLCQTCGHAEPFDAGAILESLKGYADSKGFQKHQTVIEIIGQCAEHKT